MEELKAPAAPRRPRTLGLSVAKAPIGRIASIEDFTRSKPRSGRSSISSDISISGVAENAEGINHGDVASDGSLTPLEKAVASVVLATSAILRGAISLASQIQFLLRNKKAPPKLMGGKWDKNMVRVFVDEGNFEET